MWIKISSNAAEKKLFHNRMVQERYPVPILFRKRAKSSNEFIQQCLTQIRYHRKWKMFGCAHTYSLNVNLRSVFELSIIAPRIEAQISSLSYIFYII